MGGDTPQGEMPGGRGTAGDPPCTVLVVDGDPSTRSWILRTLELASIPAVEARDGRGRTARCRRADRPDVLLTDIAMPGMSVSSWLPGSALSAPDSGGDDRRSVSAEIARAHGRSSTRWC
jgi:DNA-binding NarL/FixJ family response regulator